MQRRMKPLNYTEANAQRNTLNNVCFLNQTIPTKLVIFVYNYIYNKMASAIKVTFKYMSGK